MNASRIWTAGAVAAVIAILGAAAGLGVQPQLALASAADASTKQVEQVNDSTQIELARLAKLAATQSALEQEDARLGSAATGSLRLNTFSRQLRNAAALNGVRIIALTPGQGGVYTPLAAESADPSTPASGSTASPTPAPTATPTPAAVPGEFGKSDPRITGGNFVVIPVTIIVAGDEAAGVAFAQDVQQMQRLFAVDTVNFTQGTGGETPPSTTISGNIYSLKR